ncbi:response regulator [bacterium]|nr:response regulator [bacterium]
MRAIVIDDSRTMRVMLSRILKEFNFEILEAGHGQEALDCLAKNGPVDLALVDWNMPVMNGLEFIKSVRQIPEHEKMWIMMVTTETEMDNMVKAMVAGANEYVMKPFTRDIIVGKLELMGLIPPPPAPAQA